MTTAEQIRAKLVDRTEREIYFPVSIAYEPHITRTTTLMNMVNIAETTDQAEVRRFYHFVAWDLHPALTNMLGVATPQGR